MLGPGEYVADETQGITRVDDLPKPKLIRHSRNYRRRPCPLRQRSAYRLRTINRTLHDLGDSVTGRPRNIILTYSQHRRPKCNHYFNADMDDLAVPKSHYTHRVASLAVRLVVEDGLPYQPASWHLWRDHRIFVSWATIQNWVESTGEKAEVTIKTEYIEEALLDFSGYIAADELYDGPFCVLSIVDNHKFKHLHYAVLNHNHPTNEDIKRFFRRFKQMPDARGLMLKGVVERTNRRHRKMQKSIYRVRTRDHISQRIAIDMWRDEHLIGFRKTITTLHWSRNREKPENWIKECSVELLLSHKNLKFVEFNNYIFYSALMVLKLNYTL